MPSSALVFALVLFLVSAVLAKQTASISNSTFLHASNTKYTRGTQTTWQNPLVIGFGTLQITSPGLCTTDSPTGLPRLQNAYQYIVQHLSRTNGNFIFYPYTFSYDVAYPFGAMIGIDVADDPMTSFRFIAGMTNLNINTAQALYDGNIAILRILGNQYGQIVDFTYESKYFCDVLHSYLGKYDGCLSSDSFNDNAVNLIYVNEHDLNSSVLLNPDSSPRFSLVIIPDILPGSEDDIISVLSENAINCLVNFSTNGGVIYVSGKSAILFEKIGLLQNGTVQTDFMITSEDNTAYGRNCFSNPDFLEHAMCFYLYRDKYGRMPINIDSTYFLNSTNDASLRILIPLDTAEPFLLQTVDPITGDAAAWNVTNMGTIPLVSSLSVGDGTVIFNMAQASASSNPLYYPWVINALFYSLSRQVVYKVVVGSTYSDESGNPLPVPAAEENVIVPVDIYIWNLLDVAVPSTVFMGGAPSGVAVLTAPPGCTEEPVPELSSKMATYMTCVNSTGIPRFDVMHSQFLLNITDPQVTAGKSTATIFYATYTVLMNNNQNFTLDIGPIQASVSSAAALKTEAVFDPPSFYPLPGKGASRENSMNVRNGAQTAAYNITYTTIIPLVSPLLDLRNNNALSYTLQFYYDYYTKDVNGIENYSYPFSDGDHDFLDFQLLAASGVVFCPDWDTPVFTSLVDRDGTFPSIVNGTVLPPDMVNAQYNQIAPTSQLAAKQSFLTTGNSKPGPRLMAYCDTTTIKGSEAYYKAGIPASLVNSEVGTAKKEILFARADIFAQATSLVGGLDLQNHVITIDNYASVTCVPGAGDDSEQVAVNGYYSTSEELGVKATQYQNPLLLNCARTSITPQMAQSQTNGKLELTHYLLPLDEDPASLYGFNDAGIYEGYPEVSLVEAFRSSFSLDLSPHIAGGVIDIILPAGVRFDSAAPANDSLVSFSTSSHFSFNGSIVDNVPLCLPLPTVYIYSSLNDTCECTCRDTLNLSGSSGDLGVVFGDCSCNTSSNCTNFFALNTTDDVSTSNCTCQIECDVSESHNCTLECTKSGFEPFNTSCGDSAACDSLLAQFCDCSQNPNYCVAAPNKTQFSLETGNCSCLCDGIELGGCAEFTGPLSNFSYIPCVNATQCTCNCTDYFQVNPPICPPLFNATAPTLLPDSCNASNTTSFSNGPNCVRTYSDCGSCTCQTNSNSSTCGSEQYNTCTCTCNDVITTTQFGGVVSSTQITPVDPTNTQDCDCCCKSATFDTSTASYQAEQCVCKCRREAASCTTPIPSQFCQLPALTFLPSCPYNHTCVRTYFRRDKFSMDSRETTNVQCVMENLVGLPEGFSNFSAEIQFYSISFDALVLPQERFSVPINFSTSFAAANFLRLPALKMSFQHNEVAAGQRNELAQFDVAFQELLQHRTVYSRQEVHNIKNPGLVVNSDGFRLLSSLGSQPIPLLEKMEFTNSATIFSSETSRLEWQDVWSRSWAQPIRTSFSDVVPASNPNNNLELSTTFELLDASGNQVLEWESDTTTNLKLEIKLKNNYPKFFDPTFCEDNREILGTSFPVMSHSLQYGNCYQNEPVVLAGVNTTDVQRLAFLSAALCDISSNTSCTESTALGLGTCPSCNAASDLYNFGFQVNEFYPPGYITNDMWNLDINGYLMTKYSKGFPFLTGAKLPTTENKNAFPENILSVPVFKGNGFYFVEYSPKNSLGSNNFGWWTDNLQNSDSTLLAGKSSISSTDFNSSAGFAGITNLYACAFNRFRFLLDPASSQLIVPQSIFENNLVPICPFWEYFDISNFDCSLVPVGFNASNIGDIQNLLSTETDRDWLYFASSLRGGSQESLRIVSKISPAPGQFFEGPTPIFDSSQFYYLDSAIGSLFHSSRDFSTVSVSSARVDVSISPRIVSNTTSTINSVVYQLITLSDNGANLQFPEDIYTSFYGFGNAVTYVSVGGVGSTTCRLEPGTSTIVKIGLV